MNNKIATIIGISLLSIAVFSMALSAFNIALVSPRLLGGISKGLIIAGGIIYYIGTLKAKAAK